MYKAECSVLDAEVTVAPEIEMRNSSQCGALAKSNSLGFLNNRGFVRYQRLDRLPLTYVCEQNILHIGSSTNRFGGTTVLRHPAVELFELVHRYDPWHDLRVVITRHHTQAQHQQVWRLIHMVCHVDT